MINLKTFNIFKNINKIKNISSKIIKILDKMMAIFKKFNNKSFKI